MAYLYLVEAATKYSPVVQSALAAIQDSAPYQLLERLGKPPIFKKQAGKEQIILEEVHYQIEGHSYTVFCVRTVLSAGSKDYHTLCKKPEEWFRDNALSQAQVQQIETWLIGEIEKERKSNQLPDLPEDLKRWLNQSFKVESVSIYETEEWSNSIIKKEFNERRIKICEEILKIYDQFSGKANCDHLIQVKPERKNCYLALLFDEVYFLFEYIQSEKKETILLFYNIYNKKPSDADIDELLKKYPSSKKEDIIRAAKKAYPEWVLLNTDNIWLNIQNDDKANLALSTEEELILQTAKFPMFINGQAGSGKSTMLFYLFSHYCIECKENLKPLFLTYNKRLLETARNSVISILKNCHIHSEKQINIEEVKAYFYPFQHFILDNLLLTDQKSRFSKDTYISFNRFKQCFLGTYHQKDLNCLLPNRHKYSPELIWHIVRTYIKGYGYNGDFSVSDFEKLPRKDRSVSTEQYADVYDTIWKNWYSKFDKEFGLWDDQDLIRHVLKSNTSYPHFSVIFCDEAQDFTKIEFELLLKLSAFTKYNLSDHDPIPILFAGDPHQTINPTGFRWETLKTIFNYKFEQRNPRYLNIHFESLHQNYRSMPAIVKFLNLIQGFRYKYLNIHELKPQSPWKRVEGVSPCLFIMNEDITIDNLKSVADKTIIFIPTDGDEHQEWAYVKNDNELQQFAQIPEDADTPISNVMSASSSKGLEFDRVILYKFGNAINADTFQKAIKEEALNESELIALSYFFNKLYVALSRARKYLFIIDSLDGYNNFWRYFMNTDLLTSELDRGNRWSEADVLPLVKGYPTDVDNIKEGNPLKVAQEFETNGMYQSNYSLLQRAAQYYKLENRDKDALRCWAWAYWYKEQWTAAGNSFKALGEDTQAFKAYWRGANWQEIEILYNDNKKNIYFIISRYMQGKDTLDLLLSNKEFVDKCDINDPTWINKVKQKLQNDLDNVKNDFSKYASFAKELAAKGFKKLYITSGNLYYKDNGYEAAIHSWDRCEHTEHKDYYRSKYKVSDTIYEKIYWLDKLKEYSEITKIPQEIVNQEIEKQEIENPDLYFDLYFDALLKTKQITRALEYEKIEIRKRVNQILRIELDKQTLKNITQYLAKQKSGFSLIESELSKLKEFIIDKEILELLNQNADPVRFIKRKEINKDKEIMPILLQLLLEIFLKDSDTTFRNRFRIRELIREKGEEFTENHKITLLQGISLSNLNPERLSEDLYEIAVYISNYSAEIIEKDILTYLKALERTHKNPYEFDNYKKYLEQISPTPVKTEADANIEETVPKDEQNTALVDVNIIEETVPKDEQNTALVDVNIEEPTTQKYFEFNNVKIYNLPDAIQPKIEENKNRILIELPSFEIRINYNSKFILIEDYTTSKTVKIESDNKKIIWDSDSSIEDNKFSFLDKYTGEFLESGKVLFDFDTDTTQVIIEIK